VIIDQSVKVFLEQLASKSATPGGGSAAAIIGGMGAALVAMVCNLTLGKKNYEAVEAEMRSTLTAAEALRERLTELVRADVEAFNRVMAAYALPKDGAVQQEARSAAIQDALRGATEVPLACARACADVIRISRVVAEHGNSNVVTDAGVAVLAGYAGLKSAALNVYVNTSAIKDQGFVTERLSELNALLTGMDVAAEDIYREVQSRL
jgi:formiminotetrahydrofolate cyclodeaminase